MANYSYKYQLLNDHKWLKQKYIDEGLGTQDIAKLAGARTANSARQALIRANIPMRSISESQTFNRDIIFTEDHEVINGSLLGDGFLYKYSWESSDSRPAFHKRNIHYDHVAYVAQHLSPQWEQLIAPEESSDGDKSFLFRSLVQDSLRPYSDRWYPRRNQYIKVVPKGLILTPKTILHWFMDDGSTSWRTGRPNSVVLVFCSESFTKKDQERLCRQLRAFGIYARVSPCPWGTGWRIRIRESSVSNFFNFIGPCPVQVSSMKYKWKLPVRY